MSKMKSIYLVVFTMLVLTSCTDSNKKDYKYLVSLHNGSGMGWSVNSFYADSINMISTKKADVFVDGIKMKVTATNYITFHQKN